MAHQPEFDTARYNELVHPADRRCVLAALKKHLRMQKRRNQRCGQFVSRHRVRSASGHYSTHISLITMSRDASNRLAFVYGVDYLAPADLPSSPADLEKWVHDLQRLTPTSALASSPASLRRRSDRDHDPFSRTWRCAGYIISPSLFRMVRTDDGRVIELSRKQARFIALLLGSRDKTGVPAYVERSLTRRQVFDADAECRLYDNDIDRLVKLFRGYLGRAAIGTKRGYGHILRARCDECGEDQARQIAAHAR